MSNEALTMRGPVHGTKEARRVAIGSGVGAVIETYDFIGFGTAAALYFGTAFFPTGDPVTGTLAAFATLGVGFAARPIGGIIGGHLGDKVGRKPVLVASLILMGLATFVIGLLPTYSQVGLLAPGFARVRPHRPGPGLRRGMGRRDPHELRARPLEVQGQITPASSRPASRSGLLLANLVFLVSVQLGGELAWRIPVPGQHRAGRRRPDHPLQGPRVPRLRRGQGHGDIVKSPIVEVIKTDWRNIVKGIGLRIAETAGYAVSITYMISYLNSQHLADKTQTLVALCIASAIGIFATQAWARLTDRIGRRPALHLVLRLRRRSSPCRCSCWSTPACSSSSSPPS